MGVNQSNLQVQPRSNLYDLLQIERNADIETIRKAYKKLALRLHPDRNLGKEQEAATQFAKVLAAYEVLMDPQERSWYDQHDDTAEYSQYSAKVTKTAEIRSYMDPNFVKTMKPEIDEFYRLVSELFERLRNEELEAGFEADIAKEGIAAVQAPLFGHIDAEWSQTKAFYDTWSTFSTLKTFSWEDVYQVYHAEDRKSRRAMESRNKRVRDSARKEFNDTVRSLVRLIHSNDVRVKNQQLVQDKKQLDKKAKQEQRRKEQQLEQRQSATKFKEQEWAKIEAGNVESIECVVCEQFFETDTELAIHEQTREHQKLLKLMKEQLLRDAVLINEQATGKKSQFVDTAEAQLSEPGIDDLTDKVKSLSVEDIISEMDQHSRKPKKVAEPKDGTKKSKSKKRKQQRIDLQEAALKCRTCQSVFGQRDNLLEHCKVSKHAPPLFR